MSRSFDRRRTPALARWFSERVDPRITSLEVDGEHSGESHNNVVVTDGRDRWVLRYRAASTSFGSLDLQDEHRLLASLHPTSVPVAAPIALCEDREVIGRPFSVLEWVDGWVLDSQAVVDRLGPHGARHFSEQVIEVLVDIHEISPGHVAGVHRRPASEPIPKRLREMASMRRSAPGSATSAALDELTRRLAVNAPQPSTATLVHGDFKADNIMIAPAGEPGSVAAVLDWEMARIDEPFVELAQFLLTWNHPVTVPVQPACALTSPDVGFLTRDEMVERYEHASGRDASRFPYFDAFALYRLAVILDALRHRVEDDEVEDGSSEPDSSGALMVARGALEVLRRDRPE